MAPPQYRVEVSASARRDLAALAKRPPGPVLLRIDEAIRALATHPRPAGAKKLMRGEEGWRLRIGDYRVLYDVDDAQGVVTIGRVLHRSEAYRDP